MIKIKKTECNFEREPLLAPFGFKGKYISELWQTAVRLESESGKAGFGLGVQSILWSDSEIIAEYGELAGNNLMYLIMEYAAKIAVNMQFNTPVDLLDQLLPMAYEYGRKITGNPALRETFILNALVAVDNAAWQLYSSENSINSFDELIPDEFRSAMGYRNSDLASVPLISYGVTRDEILSLVNSGVFFFKIKIGSDPEKDGDQQKMLEWDKKRLFEIHQILKDIEIPYTSNGHVPYYLDANGRYDCKDRLLSFLAYAADIGALDRIILLEEPFPENYKVDVRDIPVRLVADESAHSDKDALERIQMGYGAIALKPIAKTMSMSLKILKKACEHNIPCFCADLTVNPVMVDWNKNFAARINPLPGMKIGVLESNGQQNYKNWTKLLQYHPDFGAKWIDSTNGLYKLDSTGFYEKSGGIFEAGEHYRSLFE